MNDVSPVLRTIVCLANSRKLGGQCVAGKVVEDDHELWWLRPVSTRPNGALSIKDIQFEDGRCPRPLDVLQITLKHHVPHGYQTENYVIDDEYYWTSDGRFSGRVSDLCDEDSTLWVNGYRSGSGLNDRIPLA